MASILDTPQTAANLLTVKQVSERLQVSRWTTYRWIESGHLPAIRLGTGKRSPVRVDERELEHWLFARSDG